MRHLTRFLLAVAVVCSANAARAGDLHIADVQALAKAGAWAELLSKATDVPPSERNATWNELVAKAAVARINDESLTDRNVFEESEGLLQVYPVLAGNREFMDARARRGMVAFGGCFRDAYDLQVCMTRARAFVSADPKNASLAKDMAMLVARSTSPKSPAVEFFHRAVGAARAAGDGGSKDVKEICAKSELVDAAASLFSNFDGSDPLMPKTQELVFDWCWPHLDHDKLAKAALDSDRGFANACTGLLAKKGVTGTREKKCRAAVAKK